MDTILVFPQIALRIIREQENIIGPLAWNEAEKVKGMRILDIGHGKVEFDEDPKETLNKLVAQYERLFGKISREVCRESVQDLVAELTPEEVPDSLK